MNPSLSPTTFFQAPVVEYCGGTEIGGGYICGSLCQPQAPSCFTSFNCGIDARFLNPDCKILDSSGSSDVSGEIALLGPSLGLSTQILNRDHDATYYKDMPNDLRRHGDQIRRFNGSFYQAMGRSDDSMNLGGIKVGSLELERVINLHPQVKESAAVAFNPAGGGPSQLVVFVVLKSSVPIEELLKQCRALIRRKLNPLFKVSDVVSIDALPRTATNKIMRRSLRDGYRRAKL